MNNGRGRPLTCLPNSEAALYLSFDDGPDPEWTPRILDLLAEAHARAIFFVVGTRARGAAALLRRVLAEGHQLGNHSWSHRHPWALSQGMARREVRHGTAMIADLTGQPPRHFRPPHGRLRACMLEEAEALHQTTVLWSLSAIDWGPFGVARGISRRLARARCGDIVLMHDGRNVHNKPQELVAALPEFLRTLAARGLRCAPLPTGDIGQWPAITATAPT